MDNWNSKYIRCFSIFLHFVRTKAFISMYKLSGETMYPQMCITKTREAVYTPLFTVRERRHKNKSVRAAVDLFVI